MTDGTPGAYAVLQFIPDVVRDERINVGIVAYDTERRDPVVRLSRHLSRVRALDSNADLLGLREYLTQFVSMVEAVRWDSNAFDRLRSGLEEHFLLGEPRAVVLDESRGVVEDLFLRFVGPDTARPSGRGMPSRVLLRNQIRAGLRSERLLPSVKENALIRGRTDEFRFDFAHRSNEVIWAVEILTLSATNKDRVYENARALLFKRNDLEHGKGVKRVEIDAVVAAPPRATKERKHVISIVEAAGCKSPDIEEVPGRLAALVPTKLEV